MAIKGICKLCLNEKELTYEHFPPRSAFNKNTRFYRINSSDYYENFQKYNKSRKIKAKINQGGLGDYCLCEECNNYLGFSYVNDYVNFAKICSSIIKQSDEFKSISFKFKKEEVNLKYFLKQVISIFICNNEAWFTQSYPELLKFVKDKDSSFLPEKYRFYLYLNEEGRFKNGNWSMTNIHGEVCEFTFPPFGIILSINNSEKIYEASEITAFKNYDDILLDEFNITLNKYPTYSPFPLDFRSKEDFENGIYES